MKNRVFLYLEKTTCYAGGSKKLTAISKVTKKENYLYNESGLPAHNKIKEDPKMDTETLAHTTWNCKYHIVLAPKYRRMVVYNKIKIDIGKILRQLCE